LSLPSDAGLLEESVVLAGVGFIEWAMGHFQATVSGADSRAVPFKAGRFVVLANVSFNEVVDKESNGIRCLYFPVLVEILIDDLFR
jgi:hypothetical protein